MFGGFQLMQKLPLPQVKERLSAMQTEWAKLSARGDMIHAEFAHFSSLDFFSLFEKHAVMHADSLGMNEQELFLLLDYWEGKLEVTS